MGVKKKSNEQKSGTPAKHTPGPWMVEETIGGPHGKFFSIGPGPGCECVIQMVWTPRAMSATDVANARLIAAAPELLEALEMICDSGCSLTDVITDKMLAAISKAKGV